MCTSVYTNAVLSRGGQQESPEDSRFNRQPQSEPEWAARRWDVVVIGGGNAAIVAALSASDLGATVLVLERAPRHLRGGNSRHTRNIRCVHGSDEFNTGPYSSQELWNDLCNVDEGPNNEELARFTVRDSASILKWMEDHGARWQKALRGTLHLDRTNRFFLGGGKALLNSYYRTVSAHRRITVAYDAMVHDLDFSGMSCTSVVVCAAGRSVRVHTAAVVCASGGFEANIGWLRRYWGDAVDNYIIRGTPYNDGHILSRLYEAGAGKAGSEKGFHAIALDARSPKFDGGIATRLDTIPFGVTINAAGQRFYDEGEDFWPKRYAMWGKHIAEQPGQIAYALWDSKVNGLFLPPIYGVYAGSTPQAVSAALGLDPAVVGAQVSAFNAAIVDGGTFDPTALDDCRTKGLAPDKTHWAQRLDTPPFYGVAMRPGITFTYMGVTIGDDARVLHAGGGCFENVFAAGEIMSGNILGDGYLAGFGMTIGSVWGRKAGTEAAKHVRG